MRAYRKIFSNGDFPQYIEDEQYSKYISHEYADNLQNLLEHIDEIIERLQVEKSDANEVQINKKEV